jgi:hypothetical protein
MRATRVILRAVARAMRRDVGSFAALKVNNFFLFVLLLIAGNVSVGLPPRSAYPFLLLVGFLLLFPLSSDPLAKIPAVRRAMWPLAGWQSAGLRAASLALSPIFWLAPILLLRTSVSLALAFLATAATMQIALSLMRFTPSARGKSICWRISFPGKLGPLMAAAMRQMFHLLDIYVAILIALGGCLYRFCFPSPDPAAYPIFSLLIALALSTYAQCLFGLDSEPAQTRYALLPLNLRDIVLAKDAAFLGLLLLLTLPLSALAGMTFGLASLAIGHFPALWRRNLQYRWRFTGGRFIFGIIQIVMGSSLGLAAVRSSIFYGLISLGIFVFSLAFLAPSRQRPYPTK